MSQRHVPSSGDDDGGQGPCAHRQLHGHILVTILDIDLAGPLVVSAADNDDMAAIGIAESQYVVSSRMDRSA